MKRSGTKHYAVIGQPVAHSLSPQIHHFFAKQFAMKDFYYEKIEGDRLGFEDQVRDFFLKGGAGMNVTLPFKERAYAMADHPSETAKAAKAANTLWMEDGKLRADNTDGSGLLADLKTYTQLEGKSILLLGAGGAARGVILPLLAAKPKRLLLSNRTFAKAQALKKDFPSIEICALSDLTGDVDVLINATSISYTADKMSLPAGVFSHQPFCYDLAYSISQPTAFVAFAQGQGCQAVDGLGMLLEQAARAFEIWHGLRPDVRSVQKKLKAG